MGTPFLIVVVTVRLEGGGNNDDFMKEKCKLEVEEPTMIIKEELKLVVVVYAEGLMKAYNFVFSTCSCRRYAPDDSLTLHWYIGLLVFLTCVILLL